MCAEPSPGCRDPGAYWGVGGHPSHVSSSTIPLGPNIHHASWFSSSVKEKSCTESDQSPIPGSHLGMLRRWEWAVVPKYPPDNWLF